MARLLNLLSCVHSPCENPPTVFELVPADLMLLQQQSVALKSRPVLKPTYCFKSSQKLKASQKSESHSTTIPKVSMLQTGSASGDSSERLVRADLRNPEAPYPGLARDLSWLITHWDYSPPASHAALALLSRLYFSGYE
jgi:hypothetical protein